MYNISLAENSNAQMVAQPKHSFKSIIRKGAKILCKKVRKAVKLAKKCWKKARKIIKKIDKRVQKVISVIEFAIMIYGIYQICTEANSVVEFITRIVDLLKP